MKRRWIGLVGMACSLVGCGQNAKVEEEPGDGIEINIPGVEVKVDKQDGISVKAPHTDVQVNKERVNVKAPGTDVEVNRVREQEPDGEASAN